MERDQATTGLFHLSARVFQIQSGVGSNQALWGDQFLWGDRALWGDNAFFGNRFLWDDQALWGDQTRMDALRNDLSQQTAGGDPD